MFLLMRIRYWRDTLWCTGFIFAVLVGLYMLPAQFELFNPLAEAFDDFELTDLVYSRHLGEDQNLEHIQDAVALTDTNIVLVNIGYLNRAGIAQEIFNINAHQPKLIAIDALFEVPRAPEDDSLMAQAFSETKNLILGVKLLNPNYTKGGFDSAQVTYPMFDRYALHGYVNLITDGEDKFRVSRHYSPQERSTDTAMLAFSTKIASIAYPAQTQAFLARSNEVESINFRRHEKQYRCLDVADALNPELPFSLKDKIVIMGFMGENFQSKSWEDKFFTPLNEVYIGKTAPDMFGMTVHANIVSMIAEKSFINEMPDWLALCIGVLLCMANVQVFMWIYYRLSRWYDALTKLLQLLQVLLLLYVSVLSFSFFRYKMDLAVGIAAILLAGDLLEIYMGFLKPKVLQQTAKWFRKHEPAPAAPTEE
ncbi:sensor domain CHASE2-containing protein [Flexibacter flexilis DSM 6793]|uniref:Sensor domain CHASE2-containing protein n=2 Tax=Flexibacter flexilis TaxID=998 RepID=A0A1I1I594_9BACT|nr:sensor domain CHASE2-containing protein [Flexibacter flexilis DSM 6793]